MIASAKLSQLPRDLLRAPVLRDVLTEDIVSYYEQHEDRLGLAGSVRRIAWEHKLDWTDKLLASDIWEPVNIGNPDEVTLLEVAREVIALTGSKSQLVFRPLPPGDPKVRRPDITRARDLLGWTPTVSR